MAIVVKAEHEGEIRRLLFESTPDYEALVAGLERLWPGCGERLATYTDEDGDACTLANTTFEDFLSTGDHSKKPPVLRLRLLSQPVPATVPCEPRAAEGTSGSEKEAAGFAEAGAAAASHGASGSPKAPSTQPAPPPLPELLQGALPGLLQALQGARGAPGPASTQPVGEAGFAEAGAAAASHGPFSGPKAPSTQPAPPPLPELLQGALPGLLQALQGARGAPVPASTQPAGEAAGGSAQEAQEKISLILAAFDEDGDGRLNFQEWAALVQAAWGAQAPPMAYHFLCAHLGVDEQAGLSLDDMARGYTVSGSLDWDFQAARRKLEGPGAADGQAPGPHAESVVP